MARVVVFGGAGFVGSHCVDRFVARGDTVTVIDGLMAGTGGSRTNLAGVLDGYADAGGFHLNVNVLDRATLLDAMAHPERYPQLTVRVSGYAVNFVRLTPEQQRDVVSRTFHGSL